VSEGSVSYHIYSHSVAIIGATRLVARHVL
jgi:hypothetical protein